MKRRQDCGTYSAEQSGQRLVLNIEANERWCLQKRAMRLGGTPTAGHRGRRRFTRADFLSELFYFQNGCAFVDLRHRRGRLTLVVCNIKHSAAGGGDSVGSMDLEVRCAAWAMLDETTHQSSQQSQLGALRVTRRDSVHILLAPECSTRSIPIDCRR